MQKRKNGKGKKSVKVDKKDYKKGGKGNGKGKGKHVKGKDGKGKDVKGKDGKGKDVKGKDNAKATKIKMDGKSVLVLY